MFVKNKIAKSKINGIGVFSNQFIPKSEIIWKFTPGFDLKFTKKQIKKLPKKAKEYLENYAWLSKKSGKYCFALDNAKYFNHSKNPNCFTAYYKNEKEVVTKAIRDIKKGEELTEDYRSFEKDLKHLLKNNF